MKMELSYVSFRFSRKAYPNYCLYQRLSYKFCKDILFKSETEVIQTNSKDDLENYLKKNFISNQVVIAMGAGNISSWIRNISNKI